MVEFAYNNAKNISTDHTSFEFNCGYHPRILFKKDVDPRSRLMLADELLLELRKLISFCHKNLFCTKTLQKQTYDKGVKPKNYASNDKVWLNSQYNKIKQNRKLEAKFFGPFQVLHPVEKQAYKLRLPKK